MTRFVRPMKLSPPPPATKARRRPRRVGKTAWALIFVILAAAIAAGLLLDRRARARREAVAREQATIAAQSAGVNVAAARAIAHYLAKIEAQLRDHEAALRQLEQHKVFSWNIHERAEIETDRQMIHDYLATNARLAKTMQYGADLVRAELNTAGVPPAVRDSALALFAKSQGPLIPLETRVRDCDQLLGESALAVLDLLDLNWGSWHRDDATGRLDFDNSIILATFKDYAEKTKAAAAAQAEAEQDLVAYQNRHPGTSP